MISMRYSTARRGSVFSRAPLLDVIFYSYVAALPKSENMVILRNP